MLGDRIIIMRTDTVTSTAEITLKLLMFEITIRIKYARSMTGLSFGSIYPDSDSRGHH